jgi:hypothetical protein
VTLQDYDGQLVMAFCAWHTSGSPTKALPGGGYGRHITTTSSMIGLYILNLDHATPSEDPRATGEDAITPNNTATATLALRAFAPTHYLLLLGCGT